MYVLDHHPLYCKYCIYDPQFKRIETYCYGTVRSKQEAKQLAQNRLTELNKAYALELATPVIAQSGRRNRKISRP